MQNKQYIVPTMLWVAIILLFFYLWVAVKVAEDMSHVAERLADAGRVFASVQRRLLRETEAGAAARPTTDQMVREEKMPNIGSIG